VLLRTLITASYDVFRKFWQKRGSLLRFRERGLG